MSETTNITAIEPKEYTLRALTADDIFPIAKIVSLIGIKEFKSCFASEELKSMMVNAENEEDIVTSVGISVVFDIVGIICNNLERCRKEVYAFLSSLSGKEVDEIKELSISAFAEMIMDVIQKEEFKDFIGVVSKLFK